MIGMYEVLVLLGLGAWLSVCRGTEVISSPNLVGDCLDDGGSGGGNDGTGPPVFVWKMELWSGIIVILIGSIAWWAYEAIRPPPPKLCGSPGGPRITAPRIKLRDGRHLAYKEFGVSKDKARYNIIFVHGLGGNSLDNAMIAPELFEELGVRMVCLDLPGYGESDPDPKRNNKSVALDIQDLADELRLGSKFYVVGFSIGGQWVWGCLKYIPHRLAGAAIIASVVNFWWTGIPKNIARQMFDRRATQDRWAVRVAHYAPWLFYWWNTQKWFPSLTALNGIPNLSPKDWEIMSKIGGLRSNIDYSTQQGMFESTHRDLLNAFRKWEFDPTEIDNTFTSNEGAVHLWHGVEDWIVEVPLPRSIAGKIPWIHYHEVPNVGHMIPYYEGMKETILKSLLLGDE